MMDRLVAVLARRPRLALVMVAGGVLVAAFWEPLLAGATLAPTDLPRQFAHPFNADRPFGFVPDRASGDLVNIHAHWAMVGRQFRDLAGWWDRSVGLGYPVMKGGFPVFAVPYLVLPAWFAAGAMTLLRTATAWCLTYGWMRTLGLRRSSAFVAGVSFAFSGFLVGWGGWPHANVAALAPGLLWAIERLSAEPSARRGVPVGVVGAGMVWGNSPLVTAYLFGGVVIYLLVRMAVEHRRALLSALVSLVPAGVVAAVVGMGLSYPHLRFFAEWLEWADTSHRRFGVDSAAGSEFLVTAIVPGMFGSDGHGPRWWADGNWTEFQIHVGAPVVLVAMFAMAAAAGSGSQARRRRGAVWGLWVMVVAGVLVAYVGGSPTALAQSLLGDVSGLATRAKVLISLGFAGLAGFGFEAWIDDRAEAMTARRRVGRVAVIVVVLVVSALGPGLWRWFDQATALGHRRSVGVAALPVLATGAVAFVLLGARWRGRLRPATFMVLFPVVLVVELLAFARPVPTVVDRGERLVATASHDVVAANLGPGERLAGHRTSFYPSTTQLFGVEALGGQTLKSAGYRALIEAVAPTAFSVDGGGTPTYPALQPEVSPTLPVWDALGVGVWAMQPWTPPPGEIEGPPAPMVRVDAVGPGLEGSVVVPPGGLRAVVFDAFRSAADGRLVVTVEVDGEVLETTVRRDEGVLGVAGLLSVAVPGEHLSPGAVAVVRARGTGPIGGLDLGVGVDGRLVVGTIGGGDDGVRVVATGPVTLLARDRAKAVRLHDAALVEPDVEAAAGLVVARPDLAGPVVVDTAVDLPSVPDPEAVLRVAAVEIEPSRIRVEVQTDRAALLVVPVADYPGWVATVGGRRVDLVTADAALTGVPVPAGTHEIVVSFAPEGLGSAMAVFGLTAGFGALLWWGTGRAGRRSAGHRRDFASVDG